MKSVLISIQPKWCELIASGKKTVEVRKTNPNLETPFKCYIYCTHNNRKYALHTYINSGYGRKNFGVIGNFRSGKDVVDVNSHLSAYRYNAYLAEGKVIGEFVCKQLVYIGAYIDLRGGKHLENTIFIENRTCLTDVELFKYLYKGEGRYNGGWAWFISDLVIYDKPKRLSEFFHACDKPNGTDCSVCVDRRENKCKSIKIAPQSWCYVE